MKKSKEKHGITLPIKNDPLYKKFLKTIEQMNKLQEKEKNEEQERLMKLCTCCPIHKFNW